MALNLRANTAVDVLIGPFVDKTDGNTTEDSLTLTQAEIKLSKNGQALTQKNDATSAAFDDDGYYNCELDATDTNTEGQLVLIVHQSANALPVRHEFNVLSEAAWDSLYVAKDAGFMDVNVKTVGRADAQETEANNLESACSNYSATRGLTGTAVPAVAADGVGGLPISDAGGLDLDAILVDTNSLNDTKIPQTLNLTASGNIGIDWANVENPTTAVDLSATDIQLCDTTTTLTNNVTLADGAQGGSSAVLTLKQLVISGSNAGGSVDIDNSGGVGIAVNASSHGISTVGGGGGAGLYAVGGSSDGTGMELVGGVTNGPGMTVTGQGTADGISIDAGATGIGVDIAAAGGQGVKVAAVHASGAIDIDNTGGIGVDVVASSHGVKYTGGGGGAGIYAVGGSADGTGMELVGGTTNGPGMTATGTGTGDDITAALNGSVASVVGHTAQTADHAASIAAILVDTAVIGAAGAGLSAIPWNAAWDAEVESEVNDGLVVLKLDHLVAVADADDAVDDSIVAKMAASDGDWSGFDKTTDSLEAIRDRGDAAWTTGGAGSISEILNVQPLVPNSIDLANTATVRIGLGLTNMLDDLPSTAEITPGTISIDRKAAGGTSWTNVVSAAACSEAAGLIYYDEVFDSGTGYAEGDTIRVTFKAQKITVSANDFEITGTDGWIFHTYIRQAAIIAAIKVKTDTLGTNDITVSSPVSGTGDIAFTPWDDLYNAETRSLEWTNSDGDWGGGSITGAAIGLKVEHLVSGVSSTYNGTVVTSSGTQKVRVELARADTGTFAAGQLYDYQLRAIIAGTTHHETLKIARVTPTISLFGSTS